MDKKNIILLIIASAFFIVALVFFINTFELNKKNDENFVGEEISKTKDIEDSQYTESTFYKADGTEVRISDYKDNAIVLMFFNKDNQDSIDDLKKVEEIYKNYEGKIKFFMINTAKEVDTDLQNEYTLEIYYDFYEETARNYNVTEEPSFIYINENNEVFNAKAGFTTTDALEANLDILSDNI